ncbi:hypothetical protein EXD82_03170 [Peptacetobacter hominis]|uniref:B3/B4 tRNA-binding domain-containing protein n=1 Tax=Peptacetobacter hominis TaxID=2743610 RepID=A0A544QWQ0_9FIRM|nr:phenylalanine--tRNA ligase beta subunit-related protein [Peptacetobacter hominis]TQQ85111.1 hypothetical protein EXD82_03170 [Peptacetobacter hominis]
MKFFIDKEVFRVLPDYCVGVVVVSEFDNANKVDEIAKMLDEAAVEFSEKVQGINLKEDSRIEPYRNSFRLLNINPNKFMCSIEALAKRVQKKPELPHINTLVDLGNAVSLKNFVPIGVHNVDKFEGNSMGVRFFEKGDHFLPMGGTEMEEPDEKELLYVSGNTVKTRRWTWRQSEDGKISEDTRNVVIVIDGFRGVNDDNVREAMDELRGLFKEMFGMSTITGMVDSENNVFEW